MPQDDSTSRGIPLSAFFLLMASCAVVLAMIGPMVRGAASEVGEAEVTVGAIVGAAGLCVLGIVIGGLHYHRVVNAILGGFLGLLLGVAFGLVLFIPADQFAVVMLTAFLGSLLVLGIAVAIRSTAGAARPQKTRGKVMVAAIVPPKPKRHPLDPDEDD